MRERKRSYAPGAARRFRMDAFFMMLGSSLMGMSTTSHPSAGEEGGWGRGGGRERGGEGHEGISE